MTFTPLPPPAKSNRQVQEYIRAVERGRDSYFVTRSDQGKGWYVRKVSDRRTNGSLFSTKPEAMQVARQRAARKNSRVLVVDHKGSLVSA
jgi:hypothetical protein